MNFVVKLPLSKKLIIDIIFDLIIVIVDRLIKDIIFILFKEALNADKLAYIFLRNIITEHILPEELITD